MFGDLCGFGQLGQPCPVRVDALQHPRPGQSDIAGVTSAVAGLTSAQNDSALPSNSPCTDAPESALARAGVMAPV
jgi:hypothetical protein